MNEAGVEYKDVAMRVETAVSATKLTCLDLLSHSNTDTISSISNSCSMDVYVRWTKIRKRPRSDMFSCTVFTEKTVEATYVQVWLSSSCPKLRERKGP